MEVVRARVVLRSMAVRMALLKKTPRRMERKLKQEKRAKEGPASRRAPSSDLRKKTTAAAM